MQVAPDQVNRSLWSRVSLRALTSFSSASAFRERFVGNATPGALGAIRIVVCSVALVLILWEDLPSASQIPIRLRDRMGLFELFFKLPIDFRGFVSSAAGLATLKWATASFLLLGGIGFASRVSVPLAALGCFLAGGIVRQYAWFFHTGLIPFYLLTTLSFTPCGDGWSVDAWRRRKKGKGLDPDLATPTYGWARYACWVVLAMPYVLAGLSKLRAGPPIWWSPVNFKKILLGTNLKPMHFDFDGGLAILTWPDWVWWLLGFTAVMTELGYGLVLFSRASRRLIPPGMALLHIGILFFQNILFFDLILLQLIFLDFDRLRRGSRRKEPRPPAAVTARSTDRRYALVLSVLAVTLVAWWTTKKEYYPLTCMQMFAGPVNLAPSVGYQVIFAHRESGEVFEARLEDAIPVLHDTRYRGFLSIAFSKDEKKRERTRQLLDAAAAAWNENAAPGERIVEFEIQNRLWDFAKAPDDPQHGKVTQTFRHEVRSL